MHVLVLPTVFLRELQYEIFKTNHFFTLPVREIPKNDRWTTSLMIYIFRFSFIKIALFGSFL